MAKLWRKLNICGAKWKVVIGSEDDHVDLRSSEGLCSYSDATIYIRDDVSAERRLEVLMHEIRHAVFAQVPGVRDAFSARRFRSVARREEHLVSNETPFLVAVLRANHMLKLPPKRMRK